LKDRAYVLLLCLVVATIVFYSNAFRGEFQFDDDIFISENPGLKDIAHPFRNNVLNVLTSGVRPLTQVTFTLNYLVNGYSVEGYHAVNILLHLVATVLVYLILRRVLGGLRFESGNDNRAKTMAFAGAAVFALHPVQTQAVTYIVQRSEVLASLFYVGALLLLIRFLEQKGGKSLGYWFAGMACFFLGWMSKAIIVTMPVMFFLYALYFMDRAAVKKASLGIAPMLAAGFVLGMRVIAGFKGSEHVGFGLEGLGAYEYFSTQLRVLVTYLRLIFLPVGQNIDYDYPIYRTLVDPAVLVSLIFWLGVICMSLYTLMMKGRWRRHYRVMGFGALWFLVILAPTSSVVPLKDVIFEHRLYLPMAGIVMCVISGVDMASIHVKEKYGRGLSPGTGAVLVLVLLTVLGGATYERNTVWRTKLSLWQDAVSKSPHKSRPRNNLGNCYFLRGDYMSALNNYKTAISLDPDNIEAYYNVYLALDKLGYEVDSKAYLYIFQQKLKEREARAGRT